jgi:hypothetical protein
VPSAIAEWLGVPPDVVDVEAQRGRCRSGLVGVVPAVVAVFAVDALVSVLTIGGVAFALILPLALGYGVGFAAGALISRRV